MNTLASAVLDGPTDDPQRAARRYHRHLPAAPSGTVNMWLPWRCRNWPSTPAEEHRFVVDLAHRAGALADFGDSLAAVDLDGVEHTRSDITAVLNALRGGLTADQLADKVPGLPPLRLLAGYRHLEQLRARSFDAWQGLVHDGTASALERHALDAAVLVPVLVERLFAAADLGPEAYRVTITRLASYVDATHRNVSEIETALGLWPERAVELGQRLYNPYGDAITNRVDHLARRVGTLTPTRVAALLGETSTGGCPPGQ